MLKTIMEDKKIIVFLNNDEIKSIDFSDDELLEEQFKEIFLKLNKKYDIELNGYYEINIYKDNNYGLIMEIVTEDFDYYNYFNQIDMKINISKLSSFLYEIKYEFLNSDIFENCICYKYLNKIYLKVLDNIDKYTYFKILELSNVLYGEKIEEIIRYGKKVDL